MSRSSDPTNIGDAIKQYIKKTGKEESFTSASVVSAWPEAMGALIANRTSNVYFRKGTLYVYLNSAPLKLSLIHI